MGVWTERKKKIGKIEGCVFPKSCRVAVHSNRGGYTGTKASDKMLGTFLQLCPPVGSLVESEPSHPPASFAFFLFFFIFPWGFWEVLIQKSG